jgi:tetratricopeptide (TPR) repeat protein
VKTALATAVLLLAISPAFADGDGKHDHGTVDTTRLGKVHFPITCSPDAQKQFDVATALMHSFWYAEATKAYEKVAQTDPKCAMAHWGIAMSLYEPLWEAPDPGRLKRGSQAVARARELSPTGREADYVDAIGRFYADYATVDHRTRALAYEKAMEVLSAKHPEDREAAVFYSLSLLGTALPTDKTYANQKKAGAILEKLFVAVPDHPGIAHYIIHSYDYPPLAARSLEAARKYSRIAPDSPHALHMPSHIFTRLGLWDESIQSNIASAESALRHVRKKDPESGSFDQAHALDYLMYAYLQQGREKEARRAQEELRAIRRLDRQNFAAAYALAAAPVRWALERRSWTEAASLTLSPDWFDWSRYPWAEGLVRLGRGIGLARIGKTAAAHVEVSALAEIRDALNAAKNAYWADQVEIWRLEAAGWTAQAESKPEEARKLLTDAAALEDSTEKHPVTPGPIQPAREMLGDLLLEQKQPEAALLEYEAVLKGSPARFNALYGAARGAELAGMDDKARTHFASLMELAGKNESQRRELGEARAYLARKTVSRR